MKHHLRSNEAKLAGGDTVSTQLSPANKRYDGIGDCSRYVLERYKQGDRILPDELFVARNEHLG